MKKLALFLAAVIVSAASFAQQASTQVASTATSITPPDVNTVFTFKNDNKDLGKIPYGKAVEFDVEVTNISKTAIKIEDVRVSCGCTTPKFDKGKAIEPGQTAKVTLGFNGYTEGEFTKTATIVFSGGIYKIVNFKGNGVKEEVKKDGK